MQCFSTNIDELLVITPKVFQDERGFFMETYQVDKFKELGIDTTFIQDNHAYSKHAGVLRGLHFQNPPYTQAKLVWVTRGSVLDVAVDLRKNSKTYGQHFACELSASNFKRLFVPKGFAHGYLTLEPDTEFIYKVDQIYAPKYEGGIIYNDPDLNINWGNLNFILSDKDKILPKFKEWQKLNEF